MWIVLLVLVVFRWVLFERFIGTRRMFLFDAFLFTLMGAWNLAQPGVWPWLGYIVGLLCLFLAVSSVKKYQTFLAEAQRVEDEDGADN